MTVQDLLQWKTRIDANPELLKRMSDPTLSEMWNSLEATISNVLLRPGFALNGIDMRDLSALFEAVKAEQLERDANPFFIVGETSLSDGLPNIRLDEKDGIKINFLRIIDALWELKYFKNKEGDRMTRKAVFAAFGAALGKDFSNFENDLSQAYKNAKQEGTNTAIFDAMKEEIRKKTNPE